MSGLRVFSVIRREPQPPQFGMNRLLIICNDDSGGETSTLIGSVALVEVESKLTCTEFSKTNSKKIRIYEKRNRTSICAYFLK